MSCLLRADTHLRDKTLELLAKFSRCDQDDCVPFYVAGQAVGSVNAQWQARLSEDPIFIRRADGGMALDPRIEGYEAVGSTLMRRAQSWLEQGWLTGWRGENFRVFHPDGGVFFDLERAAFRPLGLSSRAVHVNGLTRQSDGQIYMWVGRRSPFKAVEPNRLDNMVGGGVASHEDIQAALFREGWEEAGLSADSLSCLSEQSRLLALRRVARGIHREWLHVFDLWLPSGVMPENQDGEFDAFLCLPLEHVLSHILAGRFMADAALVALDCLARLGFWGASQAPIDEALQHLRMGTLSA